VQALACVLVGKYSW